MRKRVTAVATGLALVATLLLGAPAAVRATTAAELWVAQRGNASAPGSSCSRPGYVGTTHTAIQDAIDDAADNAVIHICPGTYAIGGSGLHLTGIAVALSGAGAKKTILDGGATVTADGTWVSGGVRIVTTDDDLTVLNLTMQHGAARNLADGGYGGAILNTNGNLTVLGSAFSGNSARFGGGAIRQYPAGREVTIVDSVFANNHAAEEEGGALSLSSGALITRSSFRNNSAGDGYDGGAVFSGGALNISSSSFTGNHSLYNGGAVMAANVTVVATTFSNNSAVNDGGAIYSDTDVTATQSTFTQNTSDDYGGAIYASDDAAVTNSTFTRNSAAWSGGAISASSVVVTRSTFKANSSVNEDGGAIWANDGIVTASIFTTNTALYKGGAIFLAIPSSAGVFASSGNSFTKNRAAGSGGALYIRCDDMSSEITHFRVVNTLRSNSSPDIYNPGC